jgi:hypothetical protein
MKNLRLLGGYPVMVLAGENVQIELCLGEPGGHWVIAATVVVERGRVRESVVEPSAHGRGRGGGWGLVVVAVVGQLKLADPREEGKQAVRLF